MDLKEIKKIIEKEIKSYGLSLYDLKTKREFNMSILEISLDGDNLDSNLLTKVTEVILDEINDLIPDNYYLEVSTPGAERELRSLEEVSKHIGSYIKFVSDKYNDVGVLEKVENGTLFVKINIKGRFKVIEIPYDELNKINLAVKF